jgi:hypothetical protein
VKKSKFVCIQLKIVAQLSQKPPLGNLLRKTPTRRSPTGSTGGDGEGVDSGRGSALGEASS